MGGAPGVSMTAPQDAAIRRIVMLYYAAIFLIIAIIAAILGFGGIAGAAAGIAKVLFVVFLALFVVSLIFGRRPPTGA